MRILDRYIIRLFLLNLLILFVVVIGLIVLLDLIINFDEFVQAAQRMEGDGWGRVAGTARVIVDFYTPLVFLFYVYLAGLLPLGAAAFTLATLIRNRELTAMLAGGVSMYRIAMPILVLGFGVNLLMVADQELVLPELARKVGRSHSDLKEGGARAIELRFAPDGKGALFTARAFDPQSGVMKDLTILRRRPTGDGTYGRAVERITADRATWNEANGGWVLENGVAVRREIQRDTDSTAERGSAAPAFASVRSDPQTNSGAGSGALDAREHYAIDFFPSDLDPTTIMLREKSRYRQLLSLRQLGEMIEKPEIVNAGELHRIRHTRFSMVVVNMLILAMGLPYFLRRAPGNLMVPSVKAAALGVGAWGGGFILVQVPAGDLLPPAAVAWLPVAIYLPIAFYLMDSVET